MSLDNCTADLQQPWLRGVQEVHLLDLFELCYWQAMNSCFHRSSVCGRHKAQALHWLELPLLCYALYQLFCKRPVAYSHQSLVFQEDVYNNLSRLPAQLYAPSYRRQYT